MTANFSPDGKLLALLRRADCKARRVGPRPAARSRRDRARHTRRAQDSVNIFATDSWESVASFAIATRDAQEVRRAPCAARAAFAISQRAGHVGVGLGARDCARHPHVLHGGRAQP